VTHDVSKWSEITIKAPGWKAQPDQIADLLRAMFPEDALVDYQRRVVEGALDGAVAEFRQLMEKKFSTDSAQDVAARSIIESVLSYFDPNHSDWGGYFPPRLLCPHHGIGGKVPYGRRRPVMAPCPGYPSCKAGIEIRETRR
jgi:hypothetical protein